MNRIDIRKKYLPCLLENFKDANNCIRMKIIDILIFMLTKMPDQPSRSMIHNFLNETLAKSRSIFDRKLFIIFCAKICPSISKKYFKEVFAWSCLKICEEKKKDIAIIFAKNIIPIRRKLDDISSTSKIENTLTNYKNLFHKDQYI